MGTSRVSTIKQSVKSMLGWTYLQAAKERVEALQFLTLLHECVELRHALLNEQSKHEYVDSRVGFGVRAWRVRVDIRLISCGDCKWRSLKDLTVKGKVAEKSMIWRGVGRNEIT